MRRFRLIKALAIVVLVFFGGIFLSLTILGPRDAADPRAMDCDPNSSIGENIDVTNLPTTPVGSYTEKQLANAAIIINEASNAGLPQRAAIIGLMTSIQESSLRILANDGSWEYPEGTHIMTKYEWEQAKEVAVASLDEPHEGVGHAWDALGILQQRPSAGWGAVEQIMNPTYAAATFFERLQNIDGWDQMPYEQAAEAVQVSGLPDNYAQRRDDAELIYAALQGAEVTATGQNEAHAICDNGADTGNPKTKNTSPNNDSEWVFPLETLTKIWHNYGESRGPYPHAGEDFAAPEDTPIYAAAAGQVIRASCDDLVVGRSPCQIEIDHGTHDGTQITTLYVHMYPDDLIAHVGDEVEAGEQIAQVGTNGNSTGFHLHFEVWRDGQITNPMELLEQQGVTMPG
ncbi:M23 family metallopeptidase [Glutamicibacter sp. NPDC087583]|uniref:M23 family metallopeptidase n=1 Tax=Glutamicibacter sp. NPDC087583 TaxID=3363995 RepID=UPI003801CE35